MPKTKKKKRKKKAASPQKPGQGRNACLDTLRGFAIFLMTLDHVAWLLLDQPIAPDSIRIVTRLSMPLFCVLTGFLAVGRGAANWERFFQVVLAAIAVNFSLAALYDNYQKAEILASLLVCYLAIAAVGKWFVLAVFAFLLYPLDISAEFFDFPLSAVASCVAIGGMLRQFGWRLAMLASLLISLGLWVERGIQGSFQWVTAPTVYVLLCLPLATAMVAGGVHWPSVRIWWLERIGRYPLTAYVAQYWILLLIAR